MQQLGYSGTARVDKGSKSCQQLPSEREQQIHNLSLMPVGARRVWLTVLEVTSMSVQVHLKDPACRASALIFAIQNVCQTKVTARRLTPLLRCLWLIQRLVTYKQCH